MRHHWLWLNRDWSPDANVALRSKLPLFYVIDIPSMYAHDYSCEKTQPVTSAKGDEGCLQAPTTNRFIWDVGMQAVTGYMRVYIKPNIPTDTHSKS